MEGIGGFLAWRWIFIVEGLASVVVGICGFVFLPDSPGRSRRWLRPEEIRYLEVRQRATPGRKSHGREREVSAEGKGVKYIALLDRDSWKMVWSAVSAWNVFTMGLIYMCFSAPTVALKFNLPQIVKDMCVLPALVVMQWPVKGTHSNIYSPFSLMKKAIQGYCER